MNIENRATKLYLKALPPLTVYKFLDEYKIPSPYKEIIICCCVLRLSDFKAIRKLEEYNIYLGQRTYIRRLKEALEMFRKSHSTFYKGK